MTASQSADPSSNEAVVPLGLDGTPRPLSVHNLVEHPHAQIGQPVMRDAMFGDSAIADVPAT